MENRHYVRGYYVVELRRINELGGWGLQHDLAFEGWIIDEPRKWPTFSYNEWTGNMLVHYDKEGNVLGTSEFEIFKDHDIAIQFSKGERWQRRRWARTQAEIANCILLYAINDVGLAGGCDGDTLLEPRGQLDPDWRDRRSRRFRGRSQKNLRPVRGRRGGGDG